MGQLTREECMRLQLVHACLPHTCKALAEVIDLYCVDVLEPAALHLLASAVRIWDVCHLSCGYLDNLPSSSMLPSFTYLGAAGGPAQAAVSPGRVHLQGSRVAQ